MITIGCVNQKGGVGKTTTAVNLAACLAAVGKRTLFVDMDPQGNGTSGVGIERRSPSAYDMILNKIPIRDVIRRTKWEDVLEQKKIKNIDVIPSHPNLYSANIELPRMPGYEFRLQDALLPVNQDYDIVIIDAPPSLDILCLNVLVASQYLIIPVQSEYYALEGLSMLIETINKVKESFNGKLDILGIVLTMFDSRLNLSKQVVEELERYFPDRVFKSQINRSVRLAEAPSHGLPVVYYDFHCIGAQKYINLAVEVIDAIEKRTK